MEQQAEKTEGVTGLGRRTREEIVKWNQMTALKIPEGVVWGHPLPPYWSYIDHRSPR